LHKDNFQAKAITSVVEKLRLGLQSLKRMLFSQCIELINSSTNRDLFSNLVTNNLATSFLFKGTNIMVVALTSELNFLINFVGLHVQTTKIRNQNINFLALISTRYTLKAVDTFSQLAAVYLVALCQVIDLCVRFKSQDLTNESPNASLFLGLTTKKVYDFIRDKLKVLFIIEALVLENIEEALGKVSSSIGQYNTVVYKSICFGRLHNVVLDCVKAT